MNRKEFLSLLGSTATSFALLTCLGGCTKTGGLSSDTIGPSNIDFSLDLSQPANAVLNNNGGYLYKSGIIVARTKNGQYIAVQQICTHENSSVVYQGNYSRFYCDRHGAIYSETGIVTGGPAPRALKQYNTSLDGNLLRVYS
jgi:cytochrome b6-f complex iron-sulfur subunit